MLGRPPSGRALMAGVLNGKIEGRYQGDHGHAVRQPLFPPGDQHDRQRENGIDGPQGQRIGDEDLQVAQQRPLHVQGLHEKLRRDLDRPQQEPEPDEKLEEEDASPALEAQRQGKEGDEHGDQPVNQQDLQVEQDDDGLETAGDDLFGRRIAHAHVGKIEKQDKGKNEQQSGERKADPDVFFDLRHGF